jgi:hypothetical protein
LGVDIRRRCDGTARKLLTAVMDRPNIVVIDGSAGALEPLQFVHRAPVG